MHTDLILKNGQLAEFLYTDNWDRPVYKLGNGRKVCCVNLDGTHLHSITSDGEPDSPLVDDFQPRTLLK